MTPPSPANLSNCHLGGQFTGGQDDGIIIRPPHSLHIESIVIVLMK